MRRFPRLETQQTAVLCAHYMHYRGYEPATIINAGVGESPEISIWRWLYKDASVVGIDPLPWSEDLEGKLSEKEYIQALLGAKHGVTRKYCSRCEAIKCLRPNKERKHRRDKTIKRIQQTTIDEVAKKYHPPFFIWMDIDGSELNALNGAIQTLENTKYINIEVIWRSKDDIDTIFSDGAIAAAIHQFLFDHGFVEAFRSPFQRDTMYEKR